jgi:hypothetical protein
MHRPVGYMKLLQKHGVVNRHAGLFVQNTISLQTIYS